jgi:hypothetical protein
MGGGPEPYAPTLDQTKYVAFQDANWDWRTFDFDKDNDRFERREYLIMNATDPHLEKFVARSPGRVASFLVLSKIADSIVHGRTGGV